MEVRLRHRALPHVGRPPVEDPPPPTRPTTGSA
jgi:hypothetical protein